MSAIPVLEVARQPITPRIDRQDRIELQPTPIVVVRPKVVAQPKSRSRLAIRAAVKTALFISVAVFTYASSNLLGQVMVEKARQDGIQAISKAHQAESSEMALNARVQQLQGDGAISGWASDNHFASSDTQKAPEIERPVSQGLVAIARD